MTATPLRNDNRDTYLYFGNPIYEYSLRQGIDDGFLAPYRVHRVITQWDAGGWRPSRDELDRYGRPIPDDEYQTRDFERVIALRARTKAIAHHLTEFLRKTNRFAKTIIFCVDQEHAGEMREALINLNSDLVAQYPDYVCRVTSDEGQIGRGHLSRFQDVETKSPAILTTSQLLTTGVDAPTCKNVVLARIVGSMSEFKQIIGRGTRLRDDYGKLWFNIVDYTGSAKLAAIHVPLPPLEEQRRIVVRIEELAAKIAEAQQLRQHAVDETRVYENQLSFAAFPVARGHTVGEFVRFQTGYAFKSEWFSDNGIRVARNANISHGQLDWSDTARVPDELLADYRRFELNEGDILVSLDRPIISTGVKVARVRSADLPCLLLQRVARAIFHSDAVLPDYFFAWLRSPHFVNTIDPGRSNGVPHISHKDIEKIPFTPPSHSEQREVIFRQGVLQGRINTLRCTQAEVAIKLNAMLPAILGKALRGEL
jgi:hypothetical protein